MAGSVRVEGLGEVLRALRQLPPAAERDLRRHSGQLADKLARLTRAAGVGRGRQAARPAVTVRSSGGASPTVTAGPHPLLFGTEFGARGRYGWYSAGRYRGSSGRQFPRPGGSYWFFRTADHAPEVAQQWRELADDIIRDWSA
jgi:hypothetical protein